MMQEQMTGAAMAMPADTNKAFKVHSLLFPASPKLKGVTRVTFKDEFPEVSVVYIYGSIILSLVKMYLHLHVSYSRDRII